MSSMTQCRDRCGAAVADDDAAMRAGWSFLFVARGWRCGTCVRTLALASQIVGDAASSSEDPLAPDSRGALPKETASTITAPSVKGCPHG